MSDVSVSWTIRKFHCVVRNNEIHRLFRRAWSAEFLAELKQKRKGNRRGERSSVCRAKLRRYLKQKRKCNAELAASSVAERGEKKKSGPIFKARFLSGSNLNVTAFDLVF